MALLRSYLFAPGNNKKLLEKVFTAGADAVVLDLEDAVPQSEKAEARRMVARVLEERATAEETKTYVRVNGTETGLWMEDLSVVVGPSLIGIRVPRAESLDDMKSFEEALSEIEARRGLESGRINMVGTVETAKGVLAAGDLASCPRVTNLTFGSADFTQDVGADPGEEEIETLLPRTHLVLASRAAGIDPPVASVYTKLDDNEGLRRSTEADRRLGFFGRSVIHPKQISIVHEIFTPSPEAIIRAKKIVETYEQVAGQGKGAAVTDEGQFVDIAVLRRARAVLAMARLPLAMGRDE